MLPYFASSLAFSILSCTSRNSSTVAVWPLTSQLSSLLASKSFLLCFFSSTLFFLSVFLFLRFFDMMLSIDLIYWRWKAAKVILSVSMKLAKLCRYLYVAVSWIGVLGYYCYPSFPSSYSAGFARANMSGKASLSFFLWSSRSFAHI